MIAYITIVSICYVIVYIHIWPQAWMKLSDTGVHDTQYTTQIDISLYVKEWSRILVEDSDDSCLL